MNKNTVITGDGTILLLIMPARGEIKQEDNGKHKTRV